MALEPWQLFQDSRTGNLGYKDSSGRITVPAILGQPTSARRFHHVVAAFEADTSDTPNRSLTCFLRRDGSSFGHDSVPLLSDFTPPCESEGTILFQDPASRRFGYFDSTGRVLIPARFMDAGDFHGGHAVVLPEGKRLCGDGKEWSARNACEHWTWSGVRQLIDRTGNTVVDSFNLPLEAVPDWRRIRRTATEPDTTRLRLRTVTGDILSLPDHLREFKAWFAVALPRMRTQGADRRDFLPLLYVAPHRDWQSARIAKAREGTWPMTNPVKFLAADDKRFRRFLSGLDRKPARLDISTGSGFLHAAELGLQDDCGNPDPVDHPVFEVRSLDPGGLILRSIFFVRTPQGFRIAEVD
ncbi:MAG: hypothetical protein RL318_2411 [Fibrobacterota bacterium]|jgi:hypothetical protein